MESERKFLVVHDYGTGGLWAFIAAPSAEHIREKFPDLEIVEGRPSWMTDELFDTIVETNSYEIDRIPPESWLARIPSRRKP